MKSCMGDLFLRLDNPIDHPDIFEEAKRRKDALIPIIPIACP